jgi:membrane protein DedA with SNARE-associated domain
MNVWRFSFFTFIGALPWTIGLAWAGFALGENYDQIREFVTPVEVPVVLAVVLLVAWFIWHRVREIRREQKLLRAARTRDSAD